MTEKTGIIKKFFDDKGFGFIEGGKFDIFFHVNDSSKIDANALTPGQKISYEMEKDQRGRKKAINLQIVNND